MPDFPFRFFDRESEYATVERRLPHWLQTGTLCFITLRTADSIPKHVLRQWIQERDTLLRQLGINPEDASWQQQLRALPDINRLEALRILSDRWHRHLDDCHGACVLRRAELSQIVSESLMKFDGDRYEMTDFVVMPNHIHLLASFGSESQMLSQCESWKHYTAHEINLQLGQRGRFWKQDGFDHLVRSEEQFFWLRKYIAENPSKAGLKEANLAHYSRTL